MLKQFFRQFFNYYFLWMFLLPFSAHAENLKLETVLQKTSQSNPELISVRLNEKASQAFILQSNVSPNPQLSISSIPTNKQNPYFRQADKQLRIDQTIERGQKRELRTDIANQQYQASKKTSQAIERQVLTEATRLWIELKRAQDRFELAKQQTQDAFKLNQATKIRLTTGDISKLEVERIRTDAHRAEHDEKRAFLNLQSSRLTLAQHMGADAQQATEWLVNENWESLTPSINQANITQLDNPETLSQLPEMKAAKQGIEIAEKQLFLARSQRTRDITASAQIENQPNQGGSVFGVGLSIPLLIGNDFSGDILQAEINIQQAQAQWMGLLKQLQSQTTLLLLTHAQLLEQTKTTLSDLLPSAIASTQKVTAAYQQGIATLTDLLDTKRQAYQAQTQATDLQADLAITCFMLQQLVMQTLPQKITPPVQ